jgi:two-component system copper resistance phosphate regulon response regulator CusR
MIAKKAKLLLVDDEPLVLRSLQKTLLRAGFGVETARDCTTGLATFEAAQAQGAPFDVVILDINMPGFDGLESAGAGLTLLDQLKVRRPDLPVVMLSAYDEVDKAKDAVNRGARDYCVKGREQGLVDTVNRILAG